MDRLKTIFNSVLVVLVVGFSTYFGFKNFGLEAQIPLMIGNLALLYWLVFKPIKQLIKK